MVKFAQKYEAAVRFLSYRDWGTSLSVKEARVCNKDHPEFPAYVKMLQDPIFKNKNCYLDPISEELANIKHVRAFLVMHKFSLLWKKLKYKIILDRGGSC
jgi:hypothetical protein